MQVAGIIAEYNPLHSGHLHHLEQTRAATGANYIIVAMSGDYVQRGEPAICDKFTRAQWALLAGADMVLELPTVFALGSAERFAYGGVRTLAATGALDFLCFGSETADLAPLGQAAELLAQEPLGFRARLKEQLAMGKSFPRARYDALQACGAPQEVLSVLREPNSILAVEYIRFLHKFAQDVQAVPIPRVGAGYHDAALEGAFASATAIREALYAGRYADTLSYLPMYVGARFGAGNVPPVCLQDASALILYALRRMTPEELLQLPDVQEGLENVLYRAAQQSRTLEELFAALKSKRYTMARCKRIAHCALLGLNKQLLQASMEAPPPYLRVLGFRRSARPLISAIGKRAAAPLVMRAADCTRLSAHGAAMLERDVFAHDVYALLNPAEAPVRDFKAPPVMV